MKAILAVIAATAFSLLAGTPCNNASTAAHCRVAQPKSWSDSQRAVVETTLERLRTNELGRGILAGAQANGYRVLERYVTDAQRNAKGEYVSKFGPAFVLYEPRIVGMTDAFFQIADLRDARSGYRIGDLVLLHELIHAFDNREQSTNAEFTKLTGWVFQKGTWQYTKRVSVSGYNSVYADTLTMYARGLYAEAWAKDRAFATALAFPVPRIQSLVSPAETYADILAHLLLDPGARDYLPADVQRYFDNAVFPVLRAQAERSGLVGHLAGGESGPTYIRFKSASSNK